MVKDTWWGEKGAIGTNIVMAAMMLSGVLLGPMLVSSWLSSDFTKACLASEKEFSDVVEDAGFGSTSSGFRKEVCSCLEGHAKAQGFPVETKGDWEDFQQKLGGFLRQRCSVEAE